MDSRSEGQHYLYILYQDINITTFTSEWDDFHIYLKYKAEKEGRELRTLSNTTFRHVCVKDLYKHEVGFGCSHKKISKGKLIFLVHTILTGSAKEVHDWRVQYSFQIK